MSALDAYGPAAARIAGLTWILIWVCVAVYAAVIAAGIWALVRRRHDADGSPETSRRMARAVTAAALVTTAILVALTVASHATSRGLITPPGRGAITVDVVGVQWWWNFQYHDVTPSEWVTVPNELHVPVGVPVLLRLIGRDVIHSFWVPNLHGKRDLIPGQVSEMWLRADRPGIYEGRCAEFCGLQHARMGIEVVAEPMAEFQAWIRRQRQPAAEPATAVEQRGRAVFLESTCASCHTIRGTPAGSRVGPDLTHVASRRTIAAATLPNDRDHLARWIREAQTIKEGSRMPSHVFPREDADALVAYLRSLR